MLALNWAATIRDKYDVCLGMHKRLVSLDGVEALSVSLESVDEVRHTLDLIQPEIVIHTVGLTNVEQCEANPSLAYHVNVDLTEHVAKACALAEVTLVYVSTDHLFSGKVSFSEEDHRVEPQNEYGRTKAEAEKRVLAVCSDALIIRTNFFGWGPSYRQSFSDKIITSLRGGKSLRLFTDVYYTPIVIESLVHAVHELLALRKSGDFHVVGDERLSKYQFGLKISKQFQLDENLLHPCHLAECQGLVQRPLDMSLSNKKVCAALGHKFGSVDEQIHRLFLQESLAVAKEVRRL